MRWLPTKRHSPIGLDLGSRVLKAVQMKRAGNGWCVARSVALSRATPGAPLAASEIQRLKGVLDRRGFVGNDVVLSVPSASLLSAILELPARTPGVPLEQLATAEFGRVHKLDTATVSLSTWELPASIRANRATYMMGVGARIEHLDAHVDLIEPAGLNVIAIDEPHTAAARGCLHDAAAASGMKAVIDLGWDAARLTIVQAGLVIYTRKLTDSGLSAVVSEAVELTGAIADEAEDELWRVGLAGGAASESAVADLFGSHLTSMLREAGQAFGYTGHQYPEAAMGEVLLAGGGGSIPGLPERVSATLGVPARRVGGDAASSIFALATGLALWEART